MNKTIQFVLIMLLIGGMFIPVQQLAVVAQEADEKSVTEDVVDDAVDTDDEEATGEVKSAEDEIDEEVEELKEKVESKVSELNEENKTTYSGVVSSFAEDIITLKTEGGEVDIEIDPELTTYYQIQNNSTSEINRDDIEEEDYVLVSGPKIGNTVNANAVYKDVSYIARSGTIIEVNDDSFYIRVQTLEKDIYILDIEQSTTQQLLDIKSFELETMGFSKLKEGDTVHFVIKGTSIDEEKRYSAVKMIVIPQEYFIKG